MYKTATVDRLQLGMNRADVEGIFGRPRKVLVVSMTEQGRQEILAYKIGQFDIYSLEFIENQLVRFEFLGEEIVYAPRPPLHFVTFDPPPVRPPLVEHPPTTRPPPLPPPTTPTTRPPSRPVNSIDTERPNRRTESERVNQEQSNGRNRPATSESNRTSRGNADSEQSNRNNRSSETSVQNGQNEDL